LRDIRYNGLDDDAISVAVNPAKCLWLAAKLRPRTRLGQPKFGPWGRPAAAGAHYSKYAPSGKSD